MSIKAATPYLFFNGTAQAAIAHYTRALGAVSDGVMTYADMPANVGTAAAHDKDRVMHATLRLGDAQVMLSDHTGEHPPSLEASNVHINLDFDDEADMARRFDALAEGGTVAVKLHDAFWGGKFGIVLDKFGVRWMFTSSPSQQK